MEKLRILCVECFNQIVNIKKGIAICSCCNAEYNIAEKSTQFKVRLSGGFIKTSLSYDDIVLGIKTGSIVDKGISLKSTTNCRLSFNATSAHLSINDELIPFAHLPTNPIEAGAII